MKKLLNLLTTLSIASSTTFVTSDLMTNLMTNLSIKNFNEKRHS